VNRIELEGDPRDFLVYREGSGGTVEIFDIAVNSNRRAGRGRRLVKFLFNSLPDSVPCVWAITRAENLVGQLFYENLGFEVKGVLRRFYSDKKGADAVLYGRSPRGPV
jgi:ribosomal protein S18 acetylase RimI-like enzyme